MSYHRPRAICMSYLSIEIDYFNVALKVSHFHSFKLFSFFLRRLSFRTKSHMHLCNREESFSTLMKYLCEILHKENKYSYLSRVLYS